MKIIHTSDLHIGRLLINRRRDETFSKLLDWLVGQVKEQAADAVVIAGDIFDTAIPSHNAQTIYYEFLAQLQALDPMPAVVIVGGNHDSPTLLDAPRDLLHTLGMTVQGNAGTAGPEDEVFTLYKKNSPKPLAIVCAIPFLRERELSGFGDVDHENQIAVATADHYRRAVNKALEIRAELGDENIPIIATGHLFAAGGKSSDQEERTLYIGSLGQIQGDAFPEEIDYLALGHLHKKCIIDGNPARRYSGAPLKLDFSSGYSPSICLVEFEGRKPTVTEIPVPDFDRLETVTGDWPQIEARLRELIAENVEVFADIQYTGKDILPRLSSQISSMTEGSKVSVLRCKDALRRVAHFSSGSGKDIILEDLDPMEMFRKLLEITSVPLTPEEKSAVEDAYREILHERESEDANAVQGETIGRKED